jgi:predicted amidohydrolase
MEPLTPSSNDRLQTAQTIRLALLHVAPRHDDLRYNLDLLENLIQKAAGLRANLIITPELSVSGYEFFQVLGKEWIRTEGKSILERFCQIARDNHTSLVLGCPTYDETRAAYHNSAVVIDENGQLLGMQHKILTLHGSIEGWAASGKQVCPVEWHGHKIGLLICADAYRFSLAQDLARQGADVLLSLAAWAPAEHGPNGEWERCSRETGLCFYVCNRTGQEVLLDFNGSSSVGVVDGRRILEYSRTTPAILTVDVELEHWRPAQAAFAVEEIA